MLGQGLTGSPDVASLDLLARAPGCLIDESGVGAFDQLAFPRTLPAYDGLPTTSLRTSPVKMIAFGRLWLALSSPRKGLMPFRLRCSARLRKLNRPLA